MPRGGTDRSRTKPVNSTIKLHKNDLPAGVCLHRLRRHRHRDAGPEAASRPALPRAALRRRQQRPSGATRRQGLVGPAPEGPAGGSGRAQDLPLRPLRHRHARPAPGRGTEPVYCTKIASKLARTYTDRHGLKDLCAELLGVDLSKQQQSSDWGADKLTDQQKHYAASDVLYLHALKAKLDAMLMREGRMDGRPGLLPLPARARQARPRRLRGRGHLRALTRQWAAGAECRRPIKSRSAARMSATPC